MSRIEQDFLGTREIGDDVYYGVQTIRGKENFHITGIPMNQEPYFVKALGYVKKACAMANRDLGKLTMTGKNKLSDEQVEKLLAACRTPEETDTVYCRRCVPQTKPSFFSLIFFADSMTDRAPAASVATGFSAKTCLPASTAAAIWPGRKPGGVARMTKSTSDAITF